MKIKKTITAVAVKETADQRKAKEISSQYGVLRCKASDFVREAIKFGALLVEWEQFLGKSSAGCKSLGEGLKGWLERNCPEINYSTALKYKLYAEKNVQLLGGGAMALAALQGAASVMQPDGEVIDVEGEVIEKRDKIFAEANSFAKIEQMWLDLFGDGVQQGGKKRTKGLAMPEPKAQLSAAQFAHAKWSDIIEPAVKKCARLVRLAASLTVDDAQDAIDALRPLMDALRERVKEG